MTDEKGESTNDLTELQARDNEMTAESDGVEGLTDRISPASFDSWYQERQFQQNINQGTPYFNGPSPVTPAERHSPSSLLQCKRKNAYKQLNAPEETGDPSGMFWIGSQFEEEIIVPFLCDAVVNAGEYVTNSLWVDFTAETDAGELRIKGETDPVIVTPEADPLLVTEIKTKRSVDNVDSPNKHHKAQAHAYMKGLTEKYDRTVSEAIILYGSRTTFDIEVFHVEFDPWFWRNTVLEWAAEHTTFRLQDELPPAEPEYGWECKFCSYQERCGEGESSFEDTGAAGLLPEFTEYPREKLVAYLTAHASAKLTPSLAHQYPDLAEKYGAFEWKCRGCGASIQWNEVTWDRDVHMLPPCPACHSPEAPSFLSGPSPEDQLSGQHNQEEANE